jgi:coat protein Gp5
MANNILTVSMITREAVEIFVNSNAFIKNINRQYDDEFGKSGNKIGSQLRIRLPNDYIVTNGPGISVQDTSEQQTVLTMATQQHVDVSFSSADLLLSLDDFGERILLPMMNNLAGAVASNIMTSNAETICNISANLDGGNNIISPNSGTYLDAQATLALNSAPMVGHKIINDPRTEARVVQSLSGLLNPASAISDQYYEGTMYKALGAIWFSDQTVIKHTAGTFTAGTVNGANQTGPNILTNAITGTLLVGDIITIAGVQAVNRVTKQTTGELRQFVVTANANNGATTISVYPSIIPSAGGNAVQYQTVVNSPANGAVISLFTNPGITYRKNFRYAPEMITMATGDLPLPANKVTARHKYDNVSMRYVKDYMIGTDQEVSRLDVLYGSLTPRPEWGVIVPDRV